ncbi:MAG: HDOD domain-containing protein [Woeseiaceae bacterium]|nr:HDOD domain-containing protein [Woeseiaceae bacterium]
MGEKTGSFGRLDVECELGKGSQGVVYRAFDPALKRSVAIKVITTAEESLVNVDSDNNLREGEISGKLNHPNIVSVFDAGQSEIGPYLVFEYVEGETLANILKRDGRYSISDAVPIIRATLQALAAAHGEQIVHFDLSPRNILMGADGAPRVMDFGLSQFVDRIARSADHAVGTLRYMAPEHFVGEELGPHTDVFALGSTFLEMVTGKRAMSGNTFSNIRQKIIEADPDFADLAELEGGKQFETFVRGALARNAAQRYANGAEMLTAFERFLREANLELAATETPAQHSTIEYLLRRMRRKKEFPTVSRTLADINRLTSSDSEASADKLSNVILRDFALTSKLLKLVNSSFYSVRGGKITSVSQAVVLLGLEQVRMTANSLTFFGHLKGGDTRLKDSMARSFLSGLIARHLAKTHKLPQAEEAFISGMFQSLGENLVLYYFSEEYDEMLELMRDAGLNRSEAAVKVLGVDLPTIGAAVAGDWQLPKNLIAAIEGVPDGKVVKPETVDEQLRDIAVFANELCCIAAIEEDSEKDRLLKSLLDRFSASVPMDQLFCMKLVAASIEKLKQYAPIFEISVENSPFCQTASSWVQEYREVTAKQAVAPSS